MVDIVFDGDITGEELRVAGAPTNSITVDSSGNVTNPSSVSSSLYLGAPANLVTGDGTNYSVVMDTYNTGGDVGTAYDTTTGIFTTPAAGVYTFDFSLTLDGLLEMVHTIYVQMTIGGQVMDIVYQGVPAGSLVGTVLVVQGSCTRYMATSQTAQLFLDVSDGAKTVSIAPNAGTNLKSWFTARLIG